MLRRTLSAFALVVGLALPVSTRGQDVFPGGWAPQFGYQVFAGPGAVAFGASASYGMGLPGGTFGYGYPGYGAMNPYSMGYLGGMNPNAFGNGMMGNALPVDQATNAMNPLIHSVRHATRTRRSR